MVSFLLSSILREARRYVCFLDLFLGIHPFLSCLLRSSTFVGVLQIDEHVQREIMNHRSLKHPNIIRFKEVIMQLLFSWSIIH